jgi:phosphatidylinositol alpha-1,6-mannosyltransferase
MKAPALAAITLDPTGGGISVVAQLIWSVLRERWADRARLIDMFEHENRPATLPEKVRFSVSLLRAQASGAVDWVLFSHLGLAQVQDLIPAPLRCRYGIFLHGVEAWQPLSARALRVLAHADVRFANSCYTAQKVMQMHPQVGRVEACPLALLPPQSATTPTRDAQLPPLGPHAVLAVGRMLEAERYKGHDELIDAWPRVVARVPAAVLVIAGDGNDVARLKHKAAASGAAASIVFTGFVPKPTLEALYGHSALFALPSRGEGFGLVYLEAMTQRLPCIGSVHDAASEVIVDQVTGRLVDQTDVGHLADVIADLLLDEPRRRMMGEAGRARALHDFSFDRFKNRLLSGIAAVDTPRVARAV